MSGDNRNNLYQVITVIWITIFCGLKQIHLKLINGKPYNKGSDFFGDKASEIAIQAI
jgi:hypothetical protein